MPTQTMRLNVAGQERRLTILWRRLWKDTVVALDETTLGTIASKKDLKIGLAFALPDGSQLTVKLREKGFTPELEVLHNGEPVSGSDTDPAMRVKPAYIIVFFIAGLHLLFGSLAVFGQIEPLQRIGMGPYNLLLGPIFLALAFLIKQRSLLALGAAIALFVFDAVMAFRLNVVLMERPQFGWIVVRIMLLMPMINGFKAIRALKAKQQRGQPNG